MSKLKVFYSKHKQLVLYFAFGIITTVISLAACYITLKLGEAVVGEITGLIDILGSTVQWISGVLVAFVTNKLWVFTDAEHGVRPTAKQLLTFSSSRIATYFLEVGINLLAIYLLNLLGYRSLFLLGIELTERVWAKAISSVLVVISNYFISKLFVFKAKDKRSSDTHRSDR